MLWKSLLVLSLVISAPARAESPTAAQSPVLMRDDESGIEELNPFAADIDEKLEELDRLNQRVESPATMGETLTAAGCFQLSCPVYVDVHKATQTLRLYIDGRLADQWDVSTGMAGFGTPNFNKRFDGRIYEAYTSSKYPGGDYNGLGNMPYAMFISGGIAIHGTPRGNWSRLGRPASHGCIRSHPDNAYRLNRLLRLYGVRNSWVTVR